MNTDANLQEIWKPVKGYETYYEVSSLGRIRSYLRKVTRLDGIIYYKPSKIKKLSLRKSGYISTTLTDDNSSKTVLVHRVVAEAFKENPKNKDQVNHIDGDKTNNKYDNLEWNTPLENTRHAIKLDLAKYIRGEECVGAKLKSKEVFIIRYNLKDLSSSEIAKKYGVARETIRDIKNNKNWKHV